MLQFYKTFSSQPRQICISMVILVVQATTYSSILQRCQNNCRNAQYTVLFQWQGFLVQFLLLIQWSLEFISWAHKINANFAAFCDNSEDYSFLDIFSGRSGFDCSWHHILLISNSEIQLHTCSVWNESVWRIIYQNVTVTELNWLNNFS
jgi:hypothetical protein